MATILPEKISVIINVCRGVVTNVEAYDDLQEAFKQQKEWSKDTNSLDDDVVVYEAEIKKKV